MPDMGVRVRCPAEARYNCRTLTPLPIGEEEALLQVPHTDEDNAY